MQRAALVLAASLVAVGCGSNSSGTRTITQVQTVKARKPVQTTQTVPKVSNLAPTQTPTTQSSPPPQTGGGTLGQAEAKLSEQGYSADDPSDYRSGDTLRVLVGTRKGSGDGYAKRAFFFVGGRYLGTDTSDDSANIRVEGQTDTTVTLAYALYGKNDALCCPGGTATVRYEWNGSRLVPLDPIPSRSKRG